MYTKVEKCRICGNPDLELVLDLGEQMLTGVFPKNRDERVTIGPLQLVKCVGEGDVCGLLQMGHSYDLGEMYGENYGYRSGLNASMVAHLRHKVERIQGLIALNEGDLIVDIGSNDSTTLQAYDPAGLTLVGIDPTGVKFRDFYPDNVQLIPAFFDSQLLKEQFPDRRAKVVTSFSMFYDLEAPMEFMLQVHEVLADDGIWVFEQSYMPRMLATNSYDTVCHEHLEFYALRQIKWMTDRVGFKIIDVEFNEINGGSFSVTVAKAIDDANAGAAIQKILDDEEAAGLNGLEPFKAFEQRVQKSRELLLEFVEGVHARGQTIAALGASTKGNVLLQYCGLNSEVITAVGEVNEEKFGCFTPGTWIPIIPEGTLLSQNPDFLLVLPWHFKTFFQESPAFASTRLVFPLPQLAVFDPSA